LVRGAGNLVSIDRSSGEISQAVNEISLTTFPNLKFLTASSPNFPFKPEIFDVVVFSYSLHETNDSLQSLEESFSLLKENGSIIIFEPDPEGDLCQFLKLISVQFDERKEQLEAEQHILQVACSNRTRRDILVEWLYQGNDDLRKELIAMTHRIKSELERENARKNIDVEVSNMPSVGYLLLIDRVKVWRLDK